MLMCIMLLDSKEERSFYEELYRQHSQMMYREAYVILQNVHNAEDAVENAFTRLINHSKKLQGMEEKKRKSYLLAAVKHAAVDILRKQNRRQEISLHEVSEEVLAVYDAPPADKVILQYILDLPVIYREVLQYRYALGLDNKEIASTLGISESTVRKRLERAREQLRKSMENE